MFDAIAAVYVAAHSAVTYYGVRELDAPPHFEETARTLTIRKVVRTLLLLAYAVGCVCAVACVAVRNLSHRPRARLVLARATRSMRVCVCAFCATRWGWLMNRSVQRGVTVFMYGSLGWLATLHLTCVTHAFPRSVRVYYALPAYAATVVLAYAYPRVVFSRPGFARAATAAERSACAASVCRECGAWRTERTHHCRLCARCVDDLDHHCPALGNCVGRANHTKFIALLYAYSLVPAYALYQVHRSFAHAEVCPWYVRRYLVVAYMALAPGLGAFAVYQSVVRWVLRTTTLQMIVNSRRRHAADMQKREGKRDAARDAARDEAHAQ